MNWFSASEWIAATDGSTLRNPSKWVATADTVTAEFSLFADADFCVTFSLSTGDWRLVSLTGFGAAPAIALPTTPDELRKALDRVHDAALEASR